MYRHILIHSTGILFSYERIAKSSIKEELFGSRLRKREKTTVERVVWQIFSYRAPRGLLSSNQAGAEFWVQIRDQDRDDPMAWHFDKDEQLFLSKRRLRHPDTATVTYLGEDPSPPTVVFTLTSDNVDIASDRCLVTPDKAFVSFPSLGKHLAFKGDMYHGVLGRTRNQRSTTPRVTLLVNIWLTGKPGAIQPLSDTLRSELNKSSDVAFHPGVLEVPKYVEVRHSSPSNQAQPTQEIPHYIIDNPDLSSCIIQY